MIAEYLVEFYKITSLPRTLKTQRQAEGQGIETALHVNHGITFAELVSYNEELRMDNLVAPVFKLTDLVNMYHTRLEQLGTHVIGRVHSTKL